MAKVKSVTNQPIKYILSTHHHADHSGGNVKFIAHGRNHLHRQCAQQHRGAQTVQAPPARWSGAQIVFTEESSVFLGGKEVRACYFGRGHTNGDAVIYFPALRTIHTGDLMAGNTPLIDYPGGGSLWNGPRRWTRP